MEFRYSFLRCCLHHHHHHHHHCVSHVDFNLAEVCHRKLSPMLMFFLVTGLTRIHLLLVY